MLVGPLDFGRQRFFIYSAMKQFFPFSPFLSFLFKMKIKYKKNEIFSKLLKHFFSRYSSFFFFVTLKQLYLLENKTFFFTLPIKQKS